MTESPLSLDLDRPQAELSRLMAGVLRPVIQPRDRACALDGARPGVGDGRRSIRGFRVDLDQFLLGLLLDPLPPCADLIGEALAVSEYVPRPGGTPLVIEGRLRVVERIDPLPRRGQVRTSGGIADGRHWTSDVTPLLPGASFDDSAREES